MSGHKVKVIKTTPYNDQKAGTSGLRKRTTIFKKTNYFENFIQSIFNCLPKEEVTNGTLLISGDGRYFNLEAIHTATKIAFGNGVKRVWVGVNGWVSTPAASCILRTREKGVAFGGIILTASHNPAGPDKDFGVKYNRGNGAPALEDLTNRVWECSKGLEEYRVLDGLGDNFFLNLDKEGEYKFGDCEVEVINPFEDWINCMTNIFDFPTISKFINETNFKMIYDGMHGIAGPYAKTLFFDCLKCKSEKVNLINCEPLTDFGGHHPDPNLTYAKELADSMKVHEPDAADIHTPDFAAAGDGDCDRCLVLGKGIFVTPSDSIAIISANALSCIPYFKREGKLKGIARSLPTSTAIDKVGQALGVKVYEVPTGWKYFTNLMDADCLSLCGEESFGAGSDHIREKDGLWTVLCWLSILAIKNGFGDSHTLAKTVSVDVKDIVNEFWSKYGRAYYCRYDYEEVDEGKANHVMNQLRACINAENKFDLSKSNISEKLIDNPVVYCDDFTYSDPIDKSVTANQGIRLMFSDGSRIIFRLSGTGSVGATIRVYFERFVSDRTKLGVSISDTLKTIIEIGLSVSDIPSITGRNEPNVIT